MPIPKQVKPTSGTSHPALLAMGEVEAARTFIDLLEDIETTLANSGKDAMISIKLGYKSGFQLSLKTSKTGMWYNISAPTLIEAIKTYLEGDFDNA